MLIVMVPISINSGVFEPSYNDLRFMVQNCNYFFASLIILSNQDFQVKVISITLLFKIAFSNKINLKSKWLNTINIYVRLIQIQNRSVLLEMEGFASHNFPGTQTAPSGIHGLKGCHGRKIKT